MARKFRMNRFRAVELSEFSPAHQRCFLDLSQAGTWNFGSLGCLAHINPVRFSIRQQQRPSSNDTFRANLDVVAQRGIDPNEAGFVDFDTTGDHDMRCDEAVVMDNRMVTNMIATPQCDVVANSHKGLNGVVFENEAVFTDPAYVEDGGTGADIAGESVAQCLRGKVFFLANFIEFGIT